mgnify:CR=1 FL=1
MKFTKMHGIGNDYIYVNGFVESIDNPAAFAIKYSDRHKGIGSDGLVMIMPSETSDFKMRMFNADGSESEMCGNASRCIAKYVFDKGLTDRTLISLETLAGVKMLRVFLDAEKKKKKVTVDMGAPELNGVAIPTIFDAEKVVNKNVSFGNKLAYEITAVSMGNPHTVIFMDDIDKLDISKIAPHIENSAFFPNRTNTEFIEKISDNYLKMRVWERGSGETLACGTGACAAAVAACLV